MNRIESVNNSPVRNTDLFLTSFMAMHEMLHAAVVTRAAQDHFTIGKNVSYQWTTLRKRLDSMLDQAKSSISAVHSAAKEGHKELPVVKGGSDAFNASTCMEDFIENLILIRSAVSTRREADAEAHGPASEAYWTSVMAKLDVMNEQARAAIVPMTRAANVELLEDTRPKLGVALAAPASTGAPPPSDAAGPEDEVHGVGANEYKVMLTLDATAFREIKVRADNVAHARLTAQAVAVEQQGAHFELNEGNWVYPEQIHSNAVYDSKGEELWNDGPVEMSDLDKFDEASPRQTM